METELSLLFSSIRQLLLFNNHCWEGWIMVVSMATTTCVRCRPRLLSDSEIKVVARRPSSHYFDDHCFLQQGLTWASCSTHFYSSLSDLWPQLKNIHHHLTFRGNKTTDRPAPLDEVLLFSGISLLSITSYLSWASQTLPWLRGWQLEAEMGDETFILNDW